MTNAELIEAEGRIRHKVHVLQRAVRNVVKELEAFANELADHHGIEDTARVGGEDKPPEDPPIGG